MSVLYPVSLAISILPIAAPVLLVRALVVLSSLSGAARMWLSTAHRWWACALTLWVVASAVSVPFAADTDVALVDLGRQAILCVCAFLLSIALVDERSRRAFMMGMLGVAAIGVVIVMASYVRAGTSSLDGLAQVKYQAFVEDGISLNSISFGIVLAFAIGCPVLSRGVLAACVPLVGLAVVISDSRTTLVAVVAAGAIGLALWAVRRTGWTWWRIAYFLALGCATGALAAVALLSWDGSIDLASYRDITTGRVDLWQAAWAKFLERPLAGWGGGSWATELAAYLPGAGWGSVDLLALDSGGAHNALLTTLAEKGMLAGIAALAILGVLARLALTTRVHASRLSSSAGRFAQLAPIVLVVIVVRGFAEQPGLFGYADSLVDHLAYAYAALIVAIAASLEPGEGATVRRVDGAVEPAHPRVQDVRRGTPTRWAGACSSDRR